VSNSSFYKGSLISRAQNKTDAATPRLREVADFISETARVGKTLVVTNRPVRCLLTGEDPQSRLPISAKYRGADIAHFGNVRGSNEFEGHDIVIILGRDKLAVRDAERQAMAIWYDASERIETVPPDADGRVNYPKQARRYTMRDGSERTSQVSVHPDARVLTAPASRRTFRAPRPRRQADTNFFGA
jgi:hypothetical protein